MLLSNFSVFHSGLSYLVSLASCSYTCMYTVCVIYFLHVCDVLQGMLFEQISIWTQITNPKVLALCNLKQQQKLSMQCVSFSVKNKYTLQCLSDKMASSDLS